MAASVPAPRSDPDALPIIGEGPAPRPEAIAVALALGDPRGQLVELALYADAVESGAGALASPDQLGRMLGELIGGGQVNGLDLGAPLHLIAVAEGRRTNWLVVGTAADPVALRAGLAGADARIVEHGGRVALGRLHALRLAAPWALTGLAAPPDPGLTGSISGAAVRGEVVEDLAMLLTAFAVQGAGEGTAELMAGLVATLRQVDRIDGRLRVARDVIELDATLIAQPGGALTALVAAQRPTDFEFANHLRPGPFQLVAAGSLVSGALAPAVAKASPALELIGPPDGWLALAGDFPDRTYVRRKLVRPGKLAPIRGAGLGRAIDGALRGARSRKESAAIAIDFLPAARRGQPAGAAIAFGLGFTEATMRMRATIPAVQLAAVFR